MIQLAPQPRAAAASSIWWQTAEALWRWAGDTATDENHYSKRILLAGILAGSLAVRLASGETAAADFTARRIDNVMAFETWKATTKFRPSEALNTFAGALGRMWYRA